MKWGRKGIAEGGRERDLVFVIRLWLEQESKVDGEPVWRGTVRDLRKEEGKHVSGVEAAFAVVSEAMSEALQELQDARNEDRE